MNTRMLKLTVTATLWALTAGLLLGGAAAQADVTHNYLFQFNEIPAGPGVTAPGRLTAPETMAVDSGHVWTTEFIEGNPEFNPGLTGGFRVEEFNATTGKHISQFAFATPGSGADYLAVAVGHLAGEPEPQVYLSEEAESGGSSIGVYSESGAKLASWTGAEMPAKSLSHFVTGLAVDNSTSLADSAAGDVYAADPGAGVVDVFKPQIGGKEKYVTQLTGTSPTEPFNFANQLAVAVNNVNGDVMVAETNAVDVFEPVSGMPGQYNFVRKITTTPSGPLQGIHSVAVDAAGDIYVAEERAKVIDQFSATGAYLGRLTGTPGSPFSDPQSVGVDASSNDVYVGDRVASEAAYVDVFGPSIVVPDVTTGAVSSLKSRSATVNGAVNPENAGAATCQFDYGTTKSFGEVAPCSEPVANGESAVAVHALLPALTPDTTYYYRLQASNANGTNPGEPVQDQEFTTPGPGIDQEAASNVTSVSATLDATINPHNTPTTYYFQYGTSAAYGTSLLAPPGVGIGSSEGDLSVSVHLQGLASSTVYHYRVVAIGEAGGEVVIEEGADQTFTTQAAGGDFTLPDGRAWEMVTPPNKQGAGLIAVGNEQGADIQAAEDGGAITYAASSPFAVNPQGSRSFEITQVFSAREAPGSWETQDITTPHTEGASELAVGHSAEYKLFSANLAFGLIEPVGRTPLPPLPAGAEKTLYLRGPHGEYIALVSAANVPPGTKFGGNGEDAGGVGYETASPDFSHVVLHSTGVALTKGGPVSGLYEWAEGQLQPVSVMPNGEPADGLLGVRHGISDDGSRLVWADEDTYYLRDMTRRETIEIDSGVHYTTANSEDSRVFLTTTRHLTADATTRPEKEDLYVFELTSGKSEPLAGKTVDLTVDPNAASESADVLGVIGASEDGSSVYFVANGVLGDGAEHGAKRGTCEKNESGTPSAQSCNLYLARYDAGAKAWAPPVFIATLSGADYPSWNGGGLPDLARETSRVAPNGRYLAFMSERSLTGYENRDASSGVPDEEIFLYDADTGRLVCASCDPTGARPKGLFEGRGFDENLVDYAKVWSERWLAANIPGWDSTDLGSALYQTRYLSDSGRLFFNSADALVPADVNGKEDVYEYEPAEVGSCRGSGHGESASIVYSNAAGGCVGLVSAGTSPAESAFLDASESGGDVFFLTSSRLTAQDYDTSVDVYDAHECTTGAPCAPPTALLPPPCTTGDACKPAPTPQPAIFGAPASATFSGAGNVVPPGSPAAITPRSTQAQKLAKALRACARKPKHKRALCKSRAKKRYGAKGARARKSSSTRTGR